MDEAAIAGQYNREYGLKGENAVTSQEVMDSFDVKYPNKFSSFAYGLRELKDKSYAMGRIRTSHTTRNFPDRTTTP